MSGFELLSGDPALNEMVQVLAANDICIRLASDVAAFFGTDFRFMYDRSNTHSCFHPYVPRDPLRDVFLIKLVPGTGRELEALTHELLHAKLLMHGFPWLNWAQSCRPSNLLNYIHHKLMIDDYRAMGLEVKNYYSVFGTRTEEQFEERLSDPEVNLENWCFDWMCNWVDEQIFGPEKYAEWRNVQWPRVIGKFPELALVTPQIEAWYAGTDYASPGTFVASYKLLVDIMHRRQVPDACWYHLQPGIDAPIRTFNF